MVKVRVVYGMVIAGLTYSFAGHTGIEEVAAWSPYEALTVAGNNASRIPSENERAGARAKEAYVAEIAGDPAQKCGVEDDSFTSLQGGSVC